MTESCGTEPPPDRTYRVGTVWLALLVAAVLLSGTFVTVRLLGHDRDERQPKRQLQAIAVAEGERYLGGADLGYRFAVPEGFTPAIDANGADAELLPRAWQPVHAQLRLLGGKLPESVAELTDTELAAFAVEHGDTTSTSGTAERVIDTFTAADGSAVVWVSGDGVDSNAYAYRGDRVVRIEVSPPDLAEEDTVSGYDQDTLPAALRAVVSTLEFV